MILDASDFNFEQAKPVPLKKVNLSGGFWGKYQELIRKSVIPYQWDALNDRIEGAEPSHAIRNFKIAAGLEKGEFKGFVFQDSDLYKWLEAVAYSLNSSFDIELKKTADSVIELIGKAQQENGYINTHFTIKEPENKWKNLRDCHELYCAGHMIEAAVAYHVATGDKKFIEIVCKFADHIYNTFGIEEGKKRGYPGHEEIELALVKLFKVTGEERYLKLSKYFIDERGQKPNYFEVEAKLRANKDHFDIWNHLGASYFQSHLPVREQAKAVGHAVRAVYLYSGMADVAQQTKDISLYNACKTLWDNITNRQMYVTGAIGSMSFGEAFSFDYDLPNDLAYAETCAAIGLVFFAHRMLQIETNISYADIMELALYNSVISGISLDGKRFFYVNPLEVWPEACEKNKTKSHVKVARQPWFGCACCPPNISRLVMSLGEYMYTTKDNDINVHLYSESEVTLIIHGNPVKIIQKTDYPWNETVNFEIMPTEPTDFSVNLRIPEWSRNTEAYVNNEAVDLSLVQSNGYLNLRQNWKTGDTIKLVFDMSIKTIVSHPKVKENSGKIAIKRGPIIYCIEEADNGCGLNNIVFERQNIPEIKFDKDLFGGTHTIVTNAIKIDSEDREDKLYSDNIELVHQPVRIKLIPYYLWANREPGEMMVWLREK